MVVVSERIVDLAPQIAGIDLDDVVRPAVVRVYTAARKSGR